MFSRILPRDLGDDRGRVVVAGITDEDQFADVVLGKVAGRYELQSMRAVAGGDDQRDHSALSLCQIRM